MYDELYLSLALNILFISIRQIKYFMDKYLVLFSAVPTLGFILMPLLSLVVVGLFLFFVERFVGASGLLPDRF